MLAMVFLDSQSTNYDSRNDLRFTHHIRHPVQKQGRPVPNRRSGPAECLRTDIRPADIRIVFIVLCSGR